MLKSLPTFECSALHKQVNMITAVWVVFFFGGAMYTRETNMCPKKGSIQVYDYVKSRDSKPYLECFLELKRMMGF